MCVCANIFTLGKTTFILIPHGFSIEASRRYINPFTPVVPVRTTSFVTF